MKRNVHKRLMSVRSDLESVRGPMQVILMVLASSEWAIIPKIISAAEGKPANLDIPTTTRFRFGWKHISNKE